MQLLDTMATARPAPAAARATARLDATIEQIVVATALFWALSANRPLLGAALHGRPLSEPATWGFAAAVVVIVVGAHVVLLGLVCNRWTVRPLLGVLAVATAAATYFMTAYGIYLDPSMLRNVLRTDIAEASELVGPGLVLHLALYAGLPLLLLWRVRVVRLPLVRSFVRRAALLAAATLAVVLALFAVFQPLSSLVRNQRELRYLVTPANLAWSLGTAVLADTGSARAPRQPIGLDATPGTSWAQRTKPMVLVLAVGETARTANWQLSGYPRETTPQLARLPVVNFGHVRSCGTNTEVSLPCLFAPVGRRDYDEKRIRGQESLLHVLAHAGARVHWRDGQSGCKGVCDGLSADTTAALDPAACRDGHCLDEALVADLDERLRRLQKEGSGTNVWALHMLGNHGPAYYRRYPAQFARFQPECRDDDLSHCSIEQIVNAYDNALLYTDHVLATTVAWLKLHADAVDSALLYVSDHGESLGEKGLFLHGMPMAIAPEVQTAVPMVFWASAGFERAAGLMPGCLMPALQHRAQQPLAHDHLFHTVLGLLDVDTGLYEPGLDLSAACRPAP